MMCEVRVWSLGVTLFAFCVVDRKKIYNIELVVCVLCGRRQLICRAWESDGGQKLIWR